MASQTNSPQQLTPVAFEILLTLVKGPQHGYGIKLDIEDRSSGELRLGSGTLYQAIQRLERTGMIAEADGPQSGDARRGRTYRMEAAGRRALAAELQRLNRVIEYARAQDLMSDLETS